MSKQTGDGVSRRIEVGIDEGITNWTRATLRMGVVGSTRGLPPVLPYGHPIALHPSKKGMIKDQLDDDPTTPTYRATNGSMPTGGSTQ